MITEKLQAVVDRHVAGSPRARELLAGLEGSPDKAAQAAPKR